MISSFKREGTREYTSKTLECNWSEDRARLECGEMVQFKVMDGAVVRPPDPDISIAPPTRMAYDSWGNALKSDGNLQLCLRGVRSRKTFDSSRLNADDGFREYVSMNQTFFKMPEDRDTCPMSYEANFHGTWGGPVQFDGRTKTRTGPFNRCKNEQFEAARVADGEHTVAKKMLSIETFRHAMEPRPVGGPQTGSGFGTILPRHDANDGERVLTSTAMDSWRKY
mmetsp:Transcript_27514/g.70069  ORF Transcript_27514/g.70069 Transcript_27514/m.70069 type:complete len:224 (-) Transcript_27514:238-909(-)